MKKLIAVLIIALMALFIPMSTFAEDNTTTVYLHFNNVMTNNGFQNFDYTPQKLSPGVGWNFTKKKLDNFISCKTHFEYEGDEYTFNGEWVYLDGTPVTFPVSTKYSAEQSEIHINIQPKYTVTPVKHLTVERIDPIRNTHASSSNQNKAESYTHKFETPDEVENYQFLGWKSDNDFVNPGESRTWLLDDFTERDNTITYTAQWQPAIIVNWWIDDELYHTYTGYEAVYADIDCEDVEFDLWVTEDDEEADEYYYPDDINGDVVQVDLYADVLYEGEDEEDDEWLPGIEFEEDEPGQNDTHRDTNKPVKATPSTKTSYTKYTTKYKVKQTPIVFYDINQSVEYVTEQPKLTSKESSVQVNDSFTPLTENASKDKNWALINLILTLMTVMALLKLSDKRYNIIAVIMPIISVLLFVFTEHTQYDMIMVDNWTLWMLLIYVIMLMSRILGRTKDKDDIEQPE